MQLKDIRQLMENKSINGCDPQFPEGRKGWEWKKSINTCSYTLSLSIYYQPWPGQERGTDVSVPLEHLSYDCPVGQITA